jgi:hypothetical protein
MFNPGILPLNTFGRLVTCYCDDCDYPVLVCGVRAGLLLAFSQPTCGKTLCGHSVPMHAEGFYRKNH